MLKGVLVGAATTVLATIATWSGIQIRDRYRRRRGEPDIRVARTNGGHRLVVTADPARGAVSDLAIRLTLRGGKPFQHPSDEARFRRQFPVSLRPGETREFWAILPESLALRGGSEAHLTWRDPNGSPRTERVDLPRP